jgi:hypothetical protein
VQETETTPTPTPSTWSGPRSTHIFGSIRAGRLHTIFLNSFLSCDAGKRAVFCLPGHFIRSTNLTTPVASTTRSVLPCTLLPKRRSNEYGGLGASASTHSSTVAAVRLTLSHHQERVASDGRYVWPLFGPSPLDTDALTPLVDLCAKASCPIHSPNARPGGCFGLSLSKKRAVGVVVIIIAGSCSGAVAAKDPVAPHPHECRKGRRGRCALVRSTDASSGSQGQKSAGIGHRDFLFLAETTRLPQKAATPKATSGPSCRFQRVAMLLTPLRRRLHPSILSTSPFGRLIVLGLQPTCSNQAVFFCRTAHPHPSSPPWIRYGSPWYGSRGDVMTDLSFTLTTPQRLLWPRAAKKVQRAW